MNIVLTEIFIAWVVKFDTSCGMPEHESNMIKH